jgi:simple sugar transport system permease protein
MSLTDILYFVFPLFIASTVPLALVALGALFSERSGVVNIALEGIMLMGAFAGAMTIKALEVAWDIETVLDNNPDSNILQYIALIGLLVGALTGIVFSLLHAFAAINMNANQIISATALNMFAPAFAIFTARTIYGAQQVSIQESYRIKQVGVYWKIEEIFHDIPVIGDLFELIGKLFFTNQYLSTYLGVLIFVIAVIVLYKTRIGLRLRACGENPHAADSLGINIYKIRYGGVMVSGALAGMGGVIFVLSFASEFNATVSGFGFLALAVLIFGNWKPGRIVFAAFFFAMMRVISSTYQIIPALKALGFNSEIYSMLPYIATLVILAFVSKNSAAPKAAGEPYDPGKR